MQDTREQRVGLTGSADMDDAGVSKFVAEDVDDQLEHVIVERTKRAVDEHPGRRLDQDAGKDQAQLLVLTQFPIPTAGFIEQGRKTLEAKPVERTREGARGETLGLSRDTRAPLARFREANTVCRAADKISVRRSGG